MSSTTDRQPKDSGAISRTTHCKDMTEVRRHVDALDDILVPLLVERGGYMTEAARLKQQRAAVHDDARIEYIVQRVRERAAVEGGQPDVIEAIYRSMMAAYIAYEYREFERLHADEDTQQPAAASASPGPDAGKTPPRPA